MGLRDFIAHGFSRSVHAVMGAEARVVTGPVKDVSGAAKERILLKDKLALIVSFLALVVSVTTPLVTYEWLNPKIKEENDKRMRIVLSVQDFSRLWSSSPPPIKQPDGGFSVLAGVRIIPQLRLRLKNIGPLAVRGLVVTLQPALPKNAAAKLKPPLEFQRKDDGDVTRLCLTPPLGAGELLEVRIVTSAPSGLRQLTADEENAYYAFGCDGFESDNCPFVWLTSEAGTIEARFDPSTKDPL